MLEGVSNEVHKRFHAAVHHKQANIGRLVVHTHPHKLLYVAVFNEPRGVGVVSVGLERGRRGWNEDQILFNKGIHGELDRGIEVHAVERYKTTG